MDRAIDKRTTVFGYSMGWSMHNTSDGLGGVNLNAYFVYSMNRDAFWANQWSLMWAAGENTPAN